MINVLITVGFKDVFPNEPVQGIENFLQGISREQILSACTFLMGLSPESTRYARFNDFIRMWFRSENEHFVYNIYQRCKQLEADTGRSAIIYTHLASLTLFEYAYMHADEEQTQTEVETEQNLFKAYLLINQEYNDAEMQATKSTKAFPEEVRMYYLMFTQSFAYFDIVNSNLTTTFICCLIKTIHLFEFLASRQDTSKLLSAFLEQHQIAHWKEYLRQLLPIAFLVLDKKDDSYVELTVEQGDEYEANCEFIERFILVDASPFLEDDFTPIRNTPLYRIQKGLYRVINDLFLIEKLFKSLYFSLDQINQGMYKETGIRNFRTFYSYHFSEKTLLYYILQNIYPIKNYIQYTGADLDKEGVSAAPDYYQRKGNKIFLWESKDFLVRADIKQSYDYALIEPIIKRTLYFDEKNGKIKGEAVLQLIRTIRSILKSEVSYDKFLNPRSAQIYPIIVVHHTLYNTFGLNFIVNQWFQSELGKLSREGLNITKVREVVIINIDTLIMHQDLLRTGVISLENLLNGYIKYKKLNLKGITNKTVGFQRMNKQATPFSKYADEQVKKQNIRKSPQEFLKLAYCLME